MSVVTMPLAQLVEDLSVYPRAGISSTNVSNLVQALEAGAELPLMVADRASRRVVDGFHRRRALLTVLGSDAHVEVDLRKYRSEAELLAAAVSMNTDHGLPLAQIDRRRAVLRLGDMGVDDDTIARALHVPLPRIEKIRVQVVNVVNSQGSVLRVEPVKRPLFHLQGRTMTTAQARAHRRAPGTSYSLLVSQLSDALKFDLINHADGKIIVALGELAEQLDVYLGSITATD
jgi:hypothetical protein